MEERGLNFSVHIIEPFNRYNLELLFNIEVTFVYYNV